MDEFLWDDLWTWLRESGLTPGEIRQAVRDYKYATASQEPSLG